MKIPLILIVVLLLAGLVLLAGAWSMFGEKIKAAQSVRKLEEGLYYMEYEGDYGFDATGRSVVVEYIGDRMIVTETPAVTNHYLSEGEKYGMGNEESIARFERLLEMRSAVTDTEAMRDTLESVSYSGITRWSIVYDLEARSFDFYWNRQFDQPHHFELAE